MLLLSLSWASAALAEVPVVNLPLECRQSNWTDEFGNGSCVWATMVMDCRWMLRDDIADDIREHCAGGQWADDTWNPDQNLARWFDSKGIPYAYTVDGDEEFLKRAIATRRGCGITVRGGRHMVLLVHLDDERAGIIDNNDISHIIWFDTPRLLAEWHASNGWAVTPIFPPAPPLPIQ